MLSVPLVATPILLDIGAGVVDCPVTRLR